MSEAIVIAPASLIDPTLISAHDDLTQRLRVDADFEARWAAWQSRSRTRERAFHRKLFMLIPVAAAAAAIGGWLLVR
jgi:hypothetical protein